MAAFTPTLPPRRKARRRHAGFTILELVIGSTLSAFVLLGVLAANLHLAKSGLRVTQYAEMDTHVRRSFEQLAVDAKAASAFPYNGATDITLSVAESNGTTSQFTYAWSAASQTFYRVNGADSAASTGKVVLATGVTSLTFSRLDTGGTTTFSDSATKRLNITLTLARRSAVGPATISKTANSYTLRNKPVS